jgi:hypothetical protein
VVSVNEGVGKGVGEGVDEGVNESAAGADTQQRSNASNRRWSSADVAD